MLDLMDCTRACMYIEVAYARAFTCAFVCRIGNGERAAADADDKADRST